MNGAARLEAYLLRSETTQAELARRVGVTPAAISLLLSRAGRAPSLSVASAIERETKGEVPVSAWSSERKARHVRRVSKTKQ